MTVLESGSLLHRVLEIDLSVESNGEITVYVDSVASRFGANALGIIDVFAQSKTFGQALTELAPRLKGEGALDDLIATTLLLLQAGVLRHGPRMPAISRKPYPFGFYDSPGVQIRILSDQKRRKAYLKAIGDVVRPGDIVLDLGTGSGILSVAAVRAGARHVYAIEPSNIAACAQQVFERNGVADRITLIEGWSHNLQLPERADVLTYDLVGSEPLEMRIIEITRDARARLLKPDSRSIPKSIRFSLVLAEIPTSFVEEYVYSHRQFAEWEHSYGIDFSPLQESLSEKVISAYVHPSEAAAFKWLSVPCPVWELDLQTVHTTPFPQAELEIEVTRPGRCCGVFGIVDFALSASVLFSANPVSAGNDPHWFTPVWLAVDAVPVSVGDSIRVFYRYEGRGRTNVHIN